MMLHSYWWCPSRTWRHPHCTRGGAVSSRRYRDDPDARLRVALPCRAYARRRFLSATAVATSSRQVLVVVTTRRHRFVPPLAVIMHVPTKRRARRPSARRGTYRTLLSGCVQQRSSTRRHASCPRLRSLCTCQPNVAHAAPRHAVAPTVPCCLAACSSAAALDPAPAAAVVSFPRSAFSRSRAAAAAFTG
jgi:hypothetical protein